MEQAQKVEQIKRTTEALVTAANLDNMLTSAQSQIQRLTTERDALRKALAALLKTASLYSVDGAEESVKQARALLGKA